MTLYRRDGVLPEWEPSPWDAPASVADAQEAGFHQRAQMPIAWTRIDLTSFPETGIFDHDWDWCIDTNVSYAASHAGEDLVLIRNDWFGFPDPPEWGLASRPQGARGVPWQLWGYFPDLPSGWDVPEAYPARP